jgi:hypothetical protein
VGVVGGGQFVLITTASRYCAFRPTTQFQQNACTRQSHRLTAALLWPTIAVLTSVANNTKWRTAGLLHNTYRLFNKKGSTDRHGPTYNTYRTHGLAKILRGAVTSDGDASLQLQYSPAFSYKNIRGTKNCRAGGVATEYCSWKWVPVEHPVAEPTQYSEVLTYRFSVFTLA